MLICHCRVVSDREIREAIDCGASDHCAVAKACGAGTGCGGCVPMIRELLADHCPAPGDGADDASPGSQPLASSVA